MKKTENLKSVILLLIATGIAIGLLSSTAVKLASATTLLKQTNSLSSVKVAGDEEETTEESTEETTEDATDKPADKPADKPGTDDTTAPSGDSGNGGSGNGDSGNGGSGNGDSGNGGSGDSGSGDSGSGDSGSSGGGILDTIMGLLGGLGGVELPDLGGILGGEEAPEEDAEEPEETPEDNSDEFKSIMSSYKVIVEKAKLSNIEYTKTTNRTIDWNILDNLFIGKAGDITVDDVEYFDNTVTVSGIANKDPSFIINNRFACLINTLDDGAVDEAVKSAEKTTLEDGSTKIVIEFNDSTPDGFISSVLPVLSADQVKALFNSGMSAGLTDVVVTYTGCSVELIYDAATGDIISLVQYINYDVDASGTKSFSTTITEVNTYTF